MKYGSVCSGIEAATMAWHPLGWSPAFFSEIEAFPSAVLAHHYGSNMPGEPLAKNGIPNYGDFTQIGTDAGPIDLLVGGTPCQSFSVAGKRLGLDDPRGNLALEYLALARRLRARWIVWENVPGVLSSHTDDEQAEEDEVEGDEGLESADFATFLSFVQECGYGFAYRVLDAQYVRVDEYARAVPQRRRRVFLVGYLGDWRRAAAVLLEPEGMRGDSAPRREASAGATVGALAGTSPGGGWRIGADEAAAGQLVAEVACTLPAGGNSTGGERQPGMGAETAATMLIAFNSREDPEVTFDRSGSLGSGSPQSQAVAYGLRADASRSGEAKTPSLDADGTYRLRDAGFNFCEEYAPTIETGAPPTVAFAQNQRDEVREMVVASALASEPGMKQQTYLAQGWAVRRLMPIECERLQGFPDNFTNIPWRGKDHAPDGPRYKALGNSMACNAMRWIGQRIDIMEKLIQAGMV